MPTARANPPKLGSDWCGTAEPFPFIKRAISTLASRVTTFLRRPRVTAPVTESFISQKTSPLIPLPSYVSA
ncbi:MAG: hypothetical protein BWY99_02687 [Synergistetes bacterium ADurb.BinA166]|nr:MAG: hypothetical protein BWY99_02687 [Synergistetes bacterium ADurb.BinA166]